MNKTDEKKKKQIVEKISNRLSRCDTYNMHCSVCLFSTYLRARWGAWNQRRYMLYVFNDWWLFILIELVIIICIVFALCLQFMLECVSYRCIFFFFWNQKWEKKRERKIRDNSINTSTYGFIATVINLIRTKALFNEILWFWLYISHSLSIVPLSNLIQLQKKKTLWRKKVKVRVKKLYHMERIVFSRHTHTHTRKKERVLL